MQQERTEEQVQRIRDIIEDYRSKPGALIPVLHEVQKIIGCLPRWSQEIIGEGLGVAVSEVNSIVSFYSLFSEYPKGKYCIGVCKGTACYVRNAEKIVQKLEEILKIEAGQTTPDGKYSLEILRCLGACGLGPVMTINEEVYTRVKPDQVSHILQTLEEKEKGVVTA
jgi:NADH:ubiquinone oxidoreductase subunit E